MTSLEEKMQQIALERERLAQQEAAMRDEAMAELDRIGAQIIELEQRKEQLESFLGLAEAPQRAGHGQITQLCIKAISESGGGLTSGQVKDIVEQSNPELKLSSVPSALSRLVGLGRMRRDEDGRYFMA